MEEYNEKNIKRIMRGDILDSPLIDEKINQAYDAIRDLSSVVSYEERKRTGLAGLRKAIVGLVAVLIMTPATVFASVKLAQYFGVSISSNQREVDIAITPTMEEPALAKPIQIHIHSDRNYVLEEELYGEEFAMRVYAPKDEAESGKAFWYELIYMDQSKETILSTFDNETAEELEIAGRKAIYLKKADIVDSEIENFNEKYNQGLFVFLDEYGYLLMVCGQNNLGKEGLVEIVKSMEIKEVNLKEDATPYVAYSKHQKSQFEGSIDAQNAESRKVRIIEEDMVNMCGGTFTLIDVQVLDSCEGLDGNAMCEDKIAYEKIFDEQGRVNSYKRETITYGDGISQPQRSVVERNVINPKIVYVTAQYENVNPFSNGRIEIPDLTFYEESNEGTSLYIRDYVRPDYVRDAMTDNAPFYFEETLDGKEFYFTEIQKGITTVHFAYLVDDDMLDKMALNLTPWVDSNYAPVLVDISVDK